MLLNISLGVLGFLQWSTMPVLVLLAQAGLAKLIRANLLAHVLVCLGVFCAALLIPLALLGLIPLNDAVWPWGAGAVLGALAATPLTWLVRRRYSL